jgi:hypothetical protein
MKAFSAIINIFSRSFHGGFLFGIPELVFDIGLLWTARACLQRRKIFPSWSWVGWSGNIAFPQIWNPHSRLDKQLQVWPVTIWKKRNSESSTTVDNSYHIYQSMADNSSGVELPPGWSGKERLFTHDTFHGQIFSHPFPVVTGLVPPAKCAWSPLLTCQTRRCMLNVGRPMKGNGLYRDCLVLELKDESGSQVGVIETGFTDEKDYVSGELCEIIAISEGCVRGWKETGMGPKALLNLGSRSMRWISSLNFRKRILITSTTCSGLSGRTASAIEKQLAE